MQIEKKVTRKEDGRFLVYYHFPDTATEEETQVFNGIEEEKPVVSSQKTVEDAANSELSQGGSAHV